MKIGCESQAEWAPVLLGGGLRMIVGLEVCTVHRDEITEDTHVLEDPEPLRKIARVSKLVVDFVRLNSNEYGMLKRMGTTPEKS